MKHSDQLAIYGFVKVAGIADYKPFNLNSSLQGSAYGAGAGALAGIGVQGLRHMIGGDETTDNMSLLKKLLKGALVGGTAGALTPMLGGLLGPSIGGAVGKHKMLEKSEISKYKNALSEPQYNTAHDSIAAAGKHYGRAATENMTIRDIANSFLNKEKQ
jgi:hypothetical protein